MISRRHVLLSTAAAVTMGAAPALAALPTGQVEPFPLEAVRLAGGMFKDAIDANRAYLLSLEPTFG